MPPKRGHESITRWVPWAAKTLLVLSYCSWTVQLGALIALQADCGKVSVPEKVNPALLSTLLGAVRPSPSCLICTEHDANFQLNKVQSIPISFRQH